MPEYNAKRIIKIYKGDTQVWADTASDYIDIKMAVPGLMAIKIDPDNPQIGYLFGSLVINKNSDTQTITIGTIVTDKKINIKGNICIASGFNDNQPTPIAITNNVITATFKWAEDNVDFFTNYAALDAAKGRTNTVTIS
jgi:hypothetical protein